MTLFFLLAASLVIGAVALLLAGPLGVRSGTVRESDLRATNVALARERRATLDAALASGALERDAHTDEIAALERELAAEIGAGPDRAARDGTLIAAVLVAVFVPVAAGALYLRLGDPGAVTRERTAPRSATASNAAEDGRGGQAAQAARGGTGAPPLAELLPRLEERLANEPDDLDGWRLLGRSYLGIEDFERATVALRRAVALDGEEATTLGQLAEAVAMSRGGALAGEPVELLERALDSDPASPQALWLRAIAHQQAGTHREAVTLFERLRAVVATDTAAVRTIDEMAARSRSELGDSAVADGAGVVPGPADLESGDGLDAVVPDGSEAPLPASLTVTVSLSEAARADAEPDQVVFVFARASEGPPMPLAVARLSVADLPATVTLDESMAMMPALSLGRFPVVTVGARVSRGGDAVAVAGDWFAEREGVVVGEDGEAGTGAPIELVIDAQRP